MHVNSIADGFGYKEAMAMRLLALVNKNALRAREAHLRRFTYASAPPHKVHDHAGNVHHVPVRHQSPTDWSKYTSEALRAMRAAKGCGKVPKERPKRLQQQIQIMLPWNAARRVVSFDLRKDEQGAPYFAAVKLLKPHGRNARDKRLEASLTTEQWHSLFNQMSRALRPRTTAKEA
jgi:hypothetical protein